MFINPHGHHISIVADGMGGHVGGAVASALVCEALERTMVADPGTAVPDAFSAALHAATINLADRIRIDRDLDGMGSTLLATHIDGQNLYWASVGDSLLYFYRNGGLKRLNEDHSMAPMLDQLVARGDLSPFEARNHPHRHALRSAITGYEVDMTDIPAAPTTLLPGDWVVLASDGIDTLGEDGILEILMLFSEASAEKMAAALLDAVTMRDAPFQDNTTLIAVRITAENDCNPSEAAA